MRIAALTPAVGALALSILALAACGPPKTVTTRDPTTGEEGKVTISDKDGVVRFETADGTAHFEAGDNVKVPKNLPAFAEIYPGLRIESVITGEGVGVGESGGVLTGFSADAPEKVASFYRDLIKRRGMRTVIDQAGNGTIVLNAADAKEASLYLTIVPKDGGSTVGLTYRIGES